MAVRSIWAGTLSVGLVSVGIKAYKATDEPNSETSMHQFHSACKHRINEKTICKHCNVDVASSDIVKGVETATGVVILTKEEIDAIKPASSTTMVVESFIDVNSIDPLYVGVSYFRAPDEGRAQAYVILHAAMVA